MTVFAHQYGRMGNNFFQKAAAIGYATKHGLDYSTCPWYAKNNIAFGHRVLKEQGHQYQELPFKEEWRNGYSNIVLDGYFQSAKYFDYCREEVLKALKLNNLVCTNTCCIHVRRGDYLLYPDKHPVITEEYLLRAISMMHEKTGSYNFVFCSDDMEWCRNFVHDHMPSLSNIEFHPYFSSNQDPWDDLLLGAGCEHNIISNSTFSWWQAYANSNPNKVVISPSKDNWFGPGNSHLNTSDLLPESWIQIKY